MVKKYSIKKFVIFYILYIDIFIVDIGCLLVFKYLILFENLIYISVKCIYELRLFLDVKIYNILFYFFFYIVLK